MPGRDFLRYELYVDWSGTHIGFVLFGFPSSGCEQRQLLDIGSSKLVDHRTSSYLGELSGVVYALEKTRALCGASPTIVFNDNRALVEQLQRGESVTHDVRIARQISYLLANEANTSYRFVPREINRGADLLFRGKQSPMNTAQLVQPTPRERPEMDIIAQGHQGHWGFEETKKNVELVYGTWPGLAEDVKTFVERCDRCQFHGSRQHRDPPRLEISTEFGDRMCMDIAGPFRDGQYFLVLVDSATRWCEAGVLARPRADRIIPTLERWMQQFPG